MLILAALVVIVGVRYDFEEKQGFNDNVENKIECGIQEVYKGRDICDVRASNGLNH